MIKNINKCDVEMISILFWPFNNLYFKMLKTNIRNSSGMGEQRRGLTDGDGCGGGGTMAA